VVVAGALVAFVPGTAGFVVVTAALCTLAWLERSVLLVFVAVLFLAAGLVFAPGPMGIRLGAAVVFGGVIAALLGRARPAAAAS
jgi:hypothetical protein